MSDILDIGGEFIAIDGQIVERKSLEIVEEIKRINPRLEVLCLDPDQAGFNDAPFLICERVNSPEGTVLQEIFSCWELDERVITRIQLADSHRFDIQAEIDKANQKVRDDLAKKHQEERDAAKEITEAVIGAHESSKGKYSFTREDDGAKVTIYDDRPAEVEKNDDG